MSDNPYRPRRRGTDRSGRGQDEDVLHRDAGPRGGPLPRAARRLRLRHGVPDRPPLRRRPRANLRRHARGHEDHHQQIPRTAGGAGVQIDGTSALVTGGASGLGWPPPGASSNVAGRSSSPTSPPSRAPRPSPSSAGVSQGRRDSSSRTSPTRPPCTAALDAAEEAGPLRAVVHCAGRGGDRTRIIAKDRTPARSTASPRSCGST